MTTWILTQYTKLAPMMQKVRVNGMEVDFEVDTGCEVTIISKEQYSKLWKQTDMPEWKPCSLKLKGKRWKCWVKPQ